jgi:hypothetical protein
MGNRKAREIQFQQEKEQAWKRAKTKHRNIDEDLHVPGIGLRRVQLVFLPSFETGYVWEIRKRIQNGFCIVVMFSTSPTDCALLVMKKSQYRLMYSNGSLIGLCVWNYRLSRL